MFCARHHFIKSFCLLQSTAVTADPLQMVSQPNKEQSSPRRPIFKGKVKQLSASPELYLLKGFLSGDEADHLIGKVGNGVPGLICFTVVQGYYIPWCMPVNHHSG